MERYLLPDWLCQGPPGSRGAAGSSGTEAISATASGLAGLRDYGEQRGQAGSQSHEEMWDKLGYQRGPSTWRRCYN
jgi:hypothetical protein